MCSAFAMPRTRRKVVAIKGAPGNRPPIERAGSKTKTGARLWIVGVDTLKTQLFARLAREGLVRFSAELPPVWFEQLASERAVLRYRRGQPVRDGEAFVHLVLAESGALRTRLIAAEQVDTELTRELGGGRRIVSGIELDEADQVLAYHVYRDQPGATFASYSPPVRIPASDILHIFDRLFPGHPPSPHP